jgi:hypothetical protein
MLAVVLGLASAVVSAYWAAGGQGLLVTVDGDIARWGRERSATVIAVLWFLVARFTNPEASATAVLGR